MRVVVAGAMAQRPGRGGHAWVFLQYLLGFQRLGCDVLFIDRLEDGMCVDASNRPCRPEASVNLGYVRDVMAAYGLRERTAVLVEDGAGSLGIDRTRLRRLLEGADLLVDVMGYLQAEDLLEAVGRRVFLDIDPGFVQMWWAQGLHDPFGRHDAYVTVGANLGREGCAIPTCGVEWIHTRPPVVLEHWPVVRPGRRGVTSVAAWRGPFAPLEHDGVRYGLRAHQMRALRDLPALAGLDLELALDIDPADEPDAASLRSAGWRMVDPVSVASTPCAYRRYIHESAAELMVPKSMYALARSGWFSDRSACYLASGRPVVAQDTGVSGHFPDDGGLLLFDTATEAADRLRQVQCDYPAQAEAARALAEDHFHSDRVLTRLLQDVGAA